METSAPEGPIGKSGTSRRGSLHDALFGTLFESPQRAMEILRPAMPNSLAGFPDWNVMPKLVETTFIDENPRNSQADMPLEVRLTNGRPALAHMLVERKSRPDPGAILQMAGYMVQIWKRFAEGGKERLKALPPTYPFLFHNGRAAWKDPLCPSQLMARHGNAPPIRLPGQDVILRDIAGMPAEELAEGIQTRAAMLAPGRRAMEDPRAVAEALVENAALRRRGH